MKDATQASVPDANATLQRATLESFLEAMKSQKKEHVANPSLDRPVMIYDGFCNFCRFWIGRWHERTDNKIHYRRSQQVATRFPEIPRMEFERAVQLVEPNGKITSGADAIFRALELSRAQPLALRIARTPPGLLP